MEYREHIDAAEREVRALTDAIAAGPLDARVPTCPDWEVRNLAEHVGNFGGFWTHVLCDGAGTEKRDVPPVPNGSASDVAAWFADIGADLIAQLRAIDASTTVWTWVPDQQTAAFVARRAAHELSVHRFDAESARGTPAPIEAALAADGIDEIFVMIAAWEEPGSGRGNGETLHLHGTDRGDEWMITLTPDGVQVEHTHAKGDLALRGAVSDLELVLYDRPPNGDIERFGDDAALDAWYRAFHFG